MPPHPEHQIAKRLTAFESANPSVMIWKPTQSVSGLWEAQGEGWSLEEKDPSRFLDRLIRLVSEDVSGGQPPQDQPQPEAP
jgi:hypothetical protein